MQLFCVQCGASYSIADKLLEGRKPFRIQCRRCKNSIQVGEAVGDAAPDFDIPVELDLGDRPEVPVEPAERALRDAERAPDEDQLFGKVAPRPPASASSVSTASGAVITSLITSPITAPITAPEAPSPDPSLLDLDQIAKTSTPQKPRQRRDNISGIVDIFRSRTGGGGRTLPPSGARPALGHSALTVEPTASDATVGRSERVTSWRSMVNTVALVVVIVGVGAALSLWMLRGGLSSW